MHLSIDLNADLGEEVTDDIGLLSVVTSANVACGYHAGSVTIMDMVCAEAVARGVAIGAQVSYDDRPNFGRVARDVPADQLREQVADQVGLLRESARRAGGEVAYVKPHGALYHRVAADAEQAAAVLAGATGLPVLGMPGALILGLAGGEGRLTRREGFPDRRYTPEGGLVPRTEPGAVLSDADEIASQAVALAPQVDSVCVHGDSPRAVQHALSVRSALAGAGWQLAACWPSPRSEAT